MVLPDPPGRVYDQHLQEGRLSFQRCGACERAVFFPRVICPHCGADALDWEPSTGRGRIYASTTVYARGEKPYNVALVDMDEGVRLMTRVVGIPPDDVRIGMAVRVLVHREGDHALPVAEPAGA
jgi:uncharacterized protein